MRLPLVATVGLLAIAGAAVAEAPKTAPAKAAEPQQKPTGIMLASADAVRSPAADRASTSAPAKRRVAPRVTTCRCGDAQADPQNQEQ